ncbi:carboxypeptidase s [Ephemerocybe angulata]|uniref:Carboxypeptidase s n=1 Tax=Ephemerocybe angulata TaxID=980116 RepID=A0A8H6I9P4_9AGAR|nr:carboxypeptidase s [Tulosesus angulatus]
MVNWKALIRLSVTLSVLLLAFCFSPYVPRDLRSNGEVADCRQAPSLIPIHNQELWGKANELIDGENFKLEAVKSLQMAVRIRTESFDNMEEIGEDTRWLIFKDFRSYLEDRFPFVHSSLDLTPVNTHGLFYQWKGSDSKLKPILLAAHQDVVPVDNSTLESWTYPPFEGHYDGERIWGRGSSDDKSQLISILLSRSAIELLLEQGFRPTRAVLLAFGFDEEASGFHGAQHLAEHIKSVYGHDGIAMIVDEGAGFYNLGGAMLAIPGVTEKGMYNVRIEVGGPGGHSSMPPNHTTIGILAEILTKLEEQPFPSRITADHPVSALAQCLIPNVKVVPSVLQPILRIPAFLLKFQLARDVVGWWFRDVSLLRSLVPTTQSIDMIRGGVKYNALPESAWAVINHRVSVTSSLSAVQKRYEDILKPLARKHGMPFEAFGERIADGSSPYYLIVSNATAHGVDPAPFSPTRPEDAPFQLLSGTIKATYSVHRHLKNVDEVVVAPGMMPGNTDTRYYWDLSRHIFRYNHHYGGTKPDPSANGIHTVNECNPLAQLSTVIAADVLVESIRFFTTLILNADENEL